MSALLELYFSPLGANLVFPAPSWKYPPQLVIPHSKTSIPADPEWPGHLHRVNLSFAAKQIPCNYRHSCHSIQGGETGRPAYFERKYAALIGKQAIAVIGIHVRSGISPG